MCIAAVESGRSHSIATRSAIVHPSQLTAPVLETGSVADSFQLQMTPVELKSMPPCILYTPTPFEFSKVTSSCKGGISAAPDKPLPNNHLQQYSDDQMAETARLAAALHGVIIGHRWQLLPMHDLIDHRPVPSRPVPQRTMRWLVALILGIPRARSVPGQSAL